MIKTVLAAGLAIIISTFAIADSQRSPAPEGAKVYIISPADGETVATTFTVTFGLSGMGVAPAGTEKAGTGHHHLMIDGEKMPMMDQALGKEVQHFGGGQTETTLSLAPGSHTLQLILGDKGHIPHDPPVISEKITITVR